MKRTILATATMIALTTGAAFAQSSLNTTAPGPTQQVEPGQTNNNLPNPGHPIPRPQGTATAPVTENGTVTGTATESIQQEPTSTTTGTSTMDNTTGGSMDNTTSGSMDTDTGASDSLPATGSELPLVGLIGLSALAGAFALRASRNA